MKKLKTLLFFILAQSGVQVFAQQKLTPETLVTLARVSEPKVSPDGSTVIYSVRKADIADNRSRNIIYSVTSSGNGGTPLTTEAENANSAVWRPDGRKIAYLSAMEGGETQLWEMNPDGSGKTKVTDVSGGINGFIYSPKMTHILYIKDVKLDKKVNEIHKDLPKVDARIIDGLMYRHWDSWDDYSYSHIFHVGYNDGKTTGEAVDIMKDERFDSPLQPFGGMEQICWSPDGNRIAYTSKKLNGTADAVSTNSDIYIYDIKSGKTTNLTNGLPGYDTNPMFSPEGDQIAWLSMETAGYEADKNRIMFYDFAKSADPTFSGSRTQLFRELTLNFDYTVEHFTWSPQTASKGATSRDIFFTAIINGTKQIYRYSGSANPQIARITQVTKGLHDYTAVEAAMTGKTLMLYGTKMSISYPADLFQIVPGSGVERQMSFANKPVLDKIKMGKVEGRMVKTTDGKSMLTWVIYPPDFDPAKKYPALLYCQGGPQSAVSQFFSTRWNFQQMAANGYIVVAPNRRGLPGFGEAWNDAIIGDYGGQAMKDYLSAIDQVSAEPFVDKNRLGAVGASFGGYSVYWLAGNHEKRFKSFISHCGMFNMESWFGSTEEMFFAINDNKAPYWEKPTPQNFKASPHNFVGNWDTPILVIHNEKDYRVPLTQGMEAFTAAQLKGIPSRFLYFPDENHWVSKPQNSILWQRVFFDWLDKYLK